MTEIKILTMPITWFGVFGFIADAAVAAVGLRKKL